MRQLRAADLFAGGGGFTTGAEQAGLKVIMALNHSDFALKTHTINHPEVAHSRMTTFMSDWQYYKDHMPDIDVLCASPACQGHSTAATKGGTGKRGTADDHELLRSTAHTITAALDGLAYRRALPKLVVVENVPEFRLWSFDPDKKDGSAYRHWVENFTGRGYDVSEFIVNAADTGEVPQDRKRMFVVATHKKKAPRIPQPHREHLAFGDSVDLSSGDWRPVSEATENTRARAERGRKKFPDDKAFLINLGDSQHSGRSLKRPIGTITTKVHWYLVKRDSRGRDLVRGLTVDEHRKAMAFPESYELPATPSQAVPLLGNAVCPPVARYVLEHAVEAIS